MPHDFTPGNALQCIVESHRHGWNGKICDGAENWDCGKKREFRADFCAQGDDRCRVLHLFDAVTPYFVVPDQNVAWLLREGIDALRDQIVLLSAAPWTEPRGIRQNFDRRFVSAGAYRIRDLRRREYPNNVVWEIQPYDDGWTRFPYPGLDSPRYRPIQGGQFFVEVEQTAVRRLFADLEEAAESPRFPEDDRARFKNFGENLRDWFDLARKSAERYLVDPEPRRPTSGSSAASAASAVTAGFRALAGLAGMVPKDAPPPPAKPATVVAPQQLAGAPIAVTGEAAVVRETVHPPAPRITSLIEPARAAKLRAEYGDAIVKAIQVGTMTKPLLVLSGNPGVGKSRLALSLVEDKPAEKDPLRLERTLIVPVSSTWRGREDLLGYVNPVTNDFEPTEFTRFLIQAERAWKEGDRRTRLVVFEEFNLSQPEHWLSDILVVGEYEEESLRVIMLGGKDVRGEGLAGKTRVLLSPAIRFVATINTDHTTRPLSPRVLDRAAVVELRLEAADAIKRLGLDTLLNDDQREAISYLDDRLRPKGVTFSLRTARSLRECLAQAEKLAINAWDAIDLVLDQQVLVKVRLLAHDPGDQQVIEDLKQWIEGHPAELWRCGQKIEDWSRQLAAGRDVNQA